MYFSPLAGILPRCGEIRSDRSLLGTRFNAENHEKSMVFIEFLSTAYHQVPRSPIAAMAGGYPPPSHPFRLESHFYCFDIGSREPNYAVFQQNPIVVTTQLDAPMDSDAVIAAA